jgi:predicted NAD/FAD-binding protein
MPSPDRLRIAVIGTGVSGLSAAWLLHPRHDVTVYEKAGRIGGHSNTVSVRLDGVEVPVDTGFIVYNAATYPNFVELLRVLGVESRDSDMSFAASLDGDRVEYSGAGVAGLFSQRANLIRPRFWGMLADLVRFYRRATRDARRPMAEETSLGDYLAAGRFGAAFRDHHIVPIASAIWSATPSDILDYPAASFLRFHDNHGLLRLTGRPIWRTVVGGSEAYVTRLAQPLGGRIRVGAGAVRIERIGGRVVVVDAQGDREVFDHVVIATHADAALGMLAAPAARERALLGAFRYSRNEAFLHLDETMMPRRRAAWASWNYISESGSRNRASVTYWMNALQRLPTRRNVFVTLNPQRPPRAVLRVESYDHPIFDAAAIRAQKELWSLQGAGGVWFCGAHFGAGFHEDGLQSGLAVAEQLGGVRRPWRVAGESGRIVVGAAPPPPPDREAAA